MNYAFPLSKSDLLLSAGFTLLWQSIDLSQGSKLVKDNEKSLALVSRMLGQESSQVGPEFLRIVTGLHLPTSTSPVQTNSAVNGVQTLNAMPAPEKRQMSSTRKHLQAIATRFSSSSFGTRPKPQEVNRRPSTQIIPPGQLGQYGRNSSQLSISSARSEPTFPALSPTSSQDSAPSAGNVNLDYYPLGNESVSTLPTMPTKDQLDSTAWEQLLVTMDSGEANIYTGIYGGLPPSEAFPSQPDGPLNVTDIDPSTLSLPVSSNSTITPTPNTYDDPSFWSHDQWPPAVTASLVDLQDIQQAHQHRSAIPQSVISYASEESVPSSGNSEDIPSLNSATSNSTYSSTGSNGGGDVGYQRNSIATTRSFGSDHTSHPQNNDCDSTSNYGGIIMPSAWE